LKSELVQPTTLEKGTADGSEEIKEADIVRLVDIQEILSCPASSKWQSSLIVD
jgi:hypothetical protein